MKLHTDRNEVERSGVASESAFRIKTTAKAFDILSSGLYTDRILAVVRELSCNAYDAHVAAGKTDVPFEIHLPNYLEPWFHVRDEGTGMSDEDVMNLYSTYFDSTKTTSNDFIGALGLGSKSPFSYTKAFEVISRHNNMRRMYSVFINEDGVPTIARLGEFNTDEPNGLEVKITVNKDDFGTFSQKLATALRWFPVKPKVIGVSNFQFAEVPKENLSGDGWMMFNHNFTNDYSRMTAVQGNVGYKVDIAKLPLTPVDQKLFNKCHVVGKFDIGDLEVAASREEIRYDDRSVQALMKCIQSVRDGILASIEAKVELMDKMNFYEQTIAIKKLAYEMFGSTELFLYFVKESKNEVLIRFYATKGVFTIPQSVAGHKLTMYSIGSRGTGQMKRSPVKGSIEPRNEYVFFFNDMKVGGVAKITQFLLERASNTYAIVISRTKINQFNVVEEEDDTPVIPSATPIVAQTKLVEEVVWTEEQYQEEFQLLREALGDVSILLASTDAPTPTCKSYSPSLAVYQYKGCNNPRYGKARVRWEAVDTAQFDITKGGLYFFIRNKSIITLVNDKGETKDVSWSANSVESHLANAIKVINQSQGTNYTVKNLYAIGVQSARRIKKMANWFNIFDILKTLMDQYKEVNEYIQQVSKTDDIMGIVGAITDKHQSELRARMVAGLATLDDTSAFKLAVQPLITAFGKYGKLVDACMMLKAVDVDLDTKVFDNNVTTGFFTKAEFTKYPMLGFVKPFTHLNLQQVDLFFDYIRTIDRS